MGREIIGESTTAANKIPAAKKKGGSPIRYRNHDVESEDEDNTSALDTDCDETESGELSRVDHRKASELGKVLGKVPDLRRPSMLQKSPPNADYEHSSPVVTDGVDGAAAATAGPLLKRFSSRGGSANRSANQTSPPFRQKLDSINESRQSSANKSGNHKSSNNRSARSIPGESISTSINSSGEEDYQTPGNFRPKAKLNFSDTAAPPAHTSSWCSWMGAFFAVGVAVTLLYTNQTSILPLLVRPPPLSLFLQQLEITPVASQPVVTRNDVTGAVKGLKEVFGAQSPDTWRQIKSNLVRVNRGESDQAFCYVVIGGESEQTDCFASAVAEVAANLRNNSFVAGVEGEVGHDTIKERLERQGSVSIFGLDTVDGNKAMVLHGFCDSATLPLTHPYVTTTIVSTIRTSGAPDDVKEEVPEEYGSQVLIDAWKMSINKDKVSSLVSRVVLSATFFRPEPNSPSLDKFCARFKE